MDTATSHPAGIAGGDAGASRVALVRAARPEYPRAPFHPPAAYAELSGTGLTAQLDPDNAVYAAVREAFALVGLDAAHQGTPEWNPLGDLVRPGQRVLIKPNWVSHKHELNDSWEQIITHGAVLRPVLDYVQRALGGQGTIWLADGPMLNSDFDAICRKTGIAEVCRLHAAAPGLCAVELCDLRSVLFVTRDDVVVERRTLPGDPRGSTVVNLGRQSELFGFAGEGRYYGADYDTAEVNRHHRGECQEYQISGTAMQADVIIDVPKLKTHHKVGMTLALKGVVGLNCGRNWLPHRTQGTPLTGGDQFAESSWRQRFEARVVRGFEQASLRFPRTAPQVYRLAKRLGRLLLGRSHETIRGGGWHGNDTLWRMVLDINRALTYADAAGRLHDRPTKRRFTVIDGIVAGEGLGPVFADPRPCGVILAGSCAALVDVAATELVGFDHRQVPMLAAALRPHPLPLAPVPADVMRLVSNVPSWAGSLEQLRQADPWQFAEPLGWVDFLQRSRTRQPA
ncbi:MAG: DUF362 domain-containing protein [Pirellulales bacterium]|nr:DUF362 domain-containing protein [Pirellulales bacterium]